jgi:aminoglycoside phosphotransferase (APT) family kinase protein
MASTSVSGRGFKPVAHSVPQNWAALARWLAGSGAALGPASARQFAGGFGNLNYLVEIDGKPAVLRRPPSGTLPRGANDMAREYRILSSLWQAYPLAPRALFYCGDPNVLGAPFQIIEYRPGIVIGDAMPPAFTGRPEIGSKLSRQLVEALAELHAIDAAQIDLETLGRPAGFLGRTFESWAGRGTAVADLVGSRAFSETVAWLSQRVPADKPPSLIHSDFKLDNMILEPTSLALVAVIDWDMGTRGDPLWDLAVMLSYWAEPDDPVCIHRMRQMPTAQPGFLRRREVLDAYQRLTSRAIDEFNFYRVLSVFRTAIVFLQLFDRYRREPGPNIGCAEFSRLGRELVDYAWEIAHGHAE